MAIRLGRTSRQMQAILRWLLAGVYVVGMLCWWWPSYRAWGAWMTAMLALWALWVLWQTHTGDRTVPAHPFCLALTVPLLLLCWHVTRTGLGIAAPTADASQELAGALNISVLWHMALLVVGILLTQSLLPRAAEHAAVLCVCGLAMTAGAAAAAAWAPEAPVRGALSLVGLAGIAVWLTALWGPPSRAADPAMPRRFRRIGCVGVAVVGAVALSAAAPGEALLAGGCAGAALVMTGLLFARHRALLLAVGGLLVVAAAVGGAWVRPDVLAVRWLPETWLGVGEAAFATVGAADSGRMVLGRMTGRVGLGCLLAGGLVALAGLLWAARRRAQTADSDVGRAVTWTVATVLASGAALAPAGSFLPLVTLAVSLTWGLLPAMLGRPSPARSGWPVVMGIFVLLGLLGAARRTGLLAWGTSMFGVGDTFQHAIAGFLAAVMLAWMLGTRHVAGGLIGIALAAAMGAAGEVLQGAFTARAMELGDAAAHAVGAVSAGVPYLLAIGARGCESSEAPEWVPR